MRDIWEHSVAFSGIPIIPVHKVKNPTEHVCKHCTTESPSLITRIQTA
jgi:hypothetical protein